MTMLADIGSIAGLWKCSLYSLAPMDTLLMIGSLLSRNLPALSAFGGAIWFLWTVYQFFLIRERESDTKQFETFHKLVKELVEPDEKTKVLYVDRQATIAFELRHFPRYHAFTLRLLKSFLAKGEKDQENLQKHALLLEELRQTIAFIEKRR